MIVCAGAAAMLQFPPTVLTGRLSAALRTVPDSQGWLRVVQVVAITGSVLVPLGFYSKFLKVQPVRDWRTVLKGCVVAAISPATLEEVERPLNGSCSVL